MNEISSYRIHVDDAVLADIRNRVSAYPWELLPDAGGWRCGTGVDFMRRLTRYWLDEYDWRTQEQRLNEWSQFTAEVDGVCLRFYHVKGSRPGRALLLTHGWPGSAYEFLHLIEPLAHPERFGGDPADSFDVVVPCLPGYGFSGPPAQPIGPRAIGRLLNRLMTDLLGYDSYLAQGGDWGGFITAWLGYDHAPACRGIHLNMVPIRTAGQPLETCEEERAWAAATSRVYAVEGGYSHQQGTRPQTLAYAMQESPVGIAAWIVEKFAVWSDLPVDENGAPDLLARYTFDDLITNIMFYVATGSFATSTWLYYALFNLEQGQSFTAGTQCEAPTAFMAFPDPVLPPAPRGFVARNFNLVQWTQPARGGHFAAMEAPEALLEDVRRFARTVDGRG